MKLEPGDLAVYPAHGVGRVEAMEMRTVGDAQYEFLVLRILDNGMKIMIPAQNVAEIGLRPLIDKSQVDKIFDIFRTPPKIADITNWNRRHREYMDRIKTGSPFEVAAVMCELLTMRMDKELSFGERKFLDTAKVLLIKEVALVSERGEPEVEAEINSFFRPTVKPVGAGK